MGEWWGVRPVNQTGVSASLVMQKLALIHGHPGIPVYMLVIEVPRQQGWKTLLQIMQISPIRLWAGMARGTLPIF
jgi:hypothetical protein